MHAREATAPMNESPIQLENVGRAAVIRLNRPRQMNALNDALMGSEGGDECVFGEKGGGVPAPLDDIWAPMPKLSNCVG